MVGKPDEKAELKSFYIYLYKEAERIMLAVIVDKEKERQYLDITELISAIDPKIKNHIAMFLANLRDIILPLNYQDDEIIRFIAAYKGFTGGSGFYAEVEAEFKKEIRDDKDKYLRELLKKEQFKDLKDLENVRIRRLYLLWAKLRSEHRPPAVYRQYREKYAYFHRKALDPLMAVAYGDGDINQAIQECTDKFYKFDQDFFTTKTIENPSSHNLSNKLSSLSSF